MKSFVISGLSCQYGRKEVLHHVDVEIPAGAITSIIGSTGSGKTTLLKAMANMICPSSGACLFDDTDIRKISRRTLAQKLAFFAQEHPDCGYLTVYELVSMGRYPHGNESAEKFREAVENAMRLAGVEEFAHQRLSELSSGTVQRAWLALALAQEPELLLLDEPGNFLDPAKKLMLAATLQQLKEEKNLTIVMVTHDIDLAIKSSDHIIALSDGRVIKKGLPAEFSGRETLEEIYGISL